MSMYSFARFEANPSQVCEAFNNMKHTKNSHHVMLDLATKYTVLKHHKGQNLVLIKGEQPAQRWVDEICFSKEKKNKPHKDVRLDNTIKKEDSITQVAIARKKYAYKKDFKQTAGQNLLTLSWHNAFCETHRYKKECKRGLFSLGKNRYYESHFVLHGLWPQPRNKMYCEVPKKHVGMDKHKQWNRLPDLVLSAQTREDLKKIMPGFHSALHKHEWVKHGTCYGTTAQQYYADAVDFVQQINHAKVGIYFTQHIGEVVTLKQVRHLFDMSFGKGAGKQVEMKCKNGMLTELWLHLGTGSNDLKTLLKRGRQTRSRCHKGRIDKAGFGR
ncbi:MAG: hypothetical protein DSZ08_03415 [Sulfurovum sp.]|nr:MAG: hypothetical protein DSZ08_03415 [Sulfurovum sp.]